jgi:polar amino acid transport system substrate-binding protein
VRFHPSARPLSPAALPVLAALAVVGSLTLGGCSSSSTGTTATSTSSTGSTGSTQGTPGASTPASTAGTADATLAALVPAAIRAKGTLVAGSDTTYAPSEFLDTDNKTPIGFDVDLFKAVAGVLGLKADIQTADFSAIIPGVTQSGKYDIGVSSFTVNADREKQVDMVSYYSAGTSWAVPTSSTLTPDTACGKKVAVQTGTVQVDDVTARSKACTAAGKQAIQIDQYQAQDAATQAVVSGKDDAMLADSPVIAYAVKQTAGKLQTAGAVYGAAPYGYVIPRTEIGFAQALQGAVQKLIADGTYGTILAKWGVQSGAITASQVAINPTGQ